MGLFTTLNQTGPNLEKPRYTPLCTLVFELSYTIVWSSMLTSKKYSKQTVKYSGYFVVTGVD